jgi:hypothetical protein
MSNRAIALRKFHQWRIQQKCNRCGNADWRTHEYHHLNETSKKDNVPTLARQSFTAAMKEMAKCIVLCANCHKITHHEENGNG